MEGQAIRIAHAGRWDMVRFTGISFPVAHPISGIATCIYGYLELPEVGVSPSRFMIDLARQIPPKRRVSQTKNLNMALVISPCHSRFPASW